MKRVEATLRGTRLLPGFIDTGATWITPTPGMGDRILVSERSLLIGGREYAVEILESYGPFAPYLLWREATTGPHWTRPILAGPPKAGIWSFAARLAPAPRGLLVEFHNRPGVVTPLVVPESITIDLGAVATDSDGDGWTDMEEGQLGLNPARADSDGDGLDDGRDVCPLYAAPPGEADDEEAQKSFGAHSSQPMD